FMTDNGGTVGVPVFNAGMKGGKVTLWEGGHRVPCFIRWPAGKLRPPGNVAELAQVRESAPPSNRGHRREHLEHAREKARGRDRALTLEGSRPAGRELPSPAAHVPRIDPRLPKLDFDASKPYVSKLGPVETSTEKPAATRPQKPVAALLGGFGRK
ncbi:MAG: hypothetical protein D4R84_05555, partial [Rhodocyclaceae bacterium]